MALVNNFTPGVRRQMIISLLILVGWGMFKSDWQIVGIQVGSALVAALLADLFLQFLRHGQWYLSQTAVISGLIVAMILALGTQPTIVAAVAALAILGKHVARLGGRHIFNPAALGLVVAALIWPQLVLTWWGDVNFWLVLIIGFMLVKRTFKMDQVVPYLVVLFAAIAVLDFARGHTAIIFKEFSAAVSLFFLLFMLVDPQTSPSPKKGRMRFGAMAGLFTFVFLQLPSVSDSLHLPSLPWLTSNALLYGLLAANLVAALHRQMQSGKSARASHTLHT